MQISLYILKSEISEIIINMNLLDTKLYIEYKLLKLV